MSTRQTRYDEDFKRTLVDLYHNGKTQSALCKEYAVFLRKIMASPSVSAACTDLWPQWIYQRCLLPNPNGKITITTMGLA